jgi:hypothetical protein
MDFEEAAQTGSVARTAAAAPAIFSRLAEIESTIKSLEAEKMALTLELLSVVDLRDLGNSSSNFSLLFVLLTFASIGDSIATITPKTTIKIVVMLLLLLLILS